MRCNACGSTIEVISTQTRSADEGATYIRTCPKCPLNASAFLSRKIEPHVYIPRIQHKKKELPVLETDGYYDIFSVCIKVSQTKALHMATGMCYNATGEDGSIFRCYTSGPYTGLCIREVSQDPIAPLTSLVHYRAAKHSNFSLDTYRGISYAVFSDYTEMIVGQDKYAFCDIEDVSMDQICDAVDTLYLAGYGPTSLNDFMSRSILGTMSNLTARGYDRSGDLPSGCRISVKPDGERVWMLRSGIVWTVSRRLVGHQIMSWCTDRSVGSGFIHSIGPCVDLELMHGHNPILIDILTNESNVMSTQQRTLLWIESKITELCDIFPYLKIVQTREWFDTIQEAEVYRLQCKYPTDGIVAIQKDGTDMFKIKSVKSMELRVDGNTLVSDEGTELIEMDSKHGYSDGSIVEVRFDSKNDNLCLLEHFLRTDKTSANKMTAVRMILQSLLSSDSPNVLRNQLWRWSNMLRTMLYNRASRMCKDKRIIMDIGTGEGQSIESFVKGKSYILVEPDYDRCVSLAKRIGIRRQDIKNDPRSLIPAMSRLIHGSIKYIILNCKLSQILDDPVVCNNITNIVGCCVSSFSAQFVIDLIPSLREMCNIPFIGSCYMYDDIGIGESIIDSSGISMTKVSDTEATVKWGKDKVYTEPALSTDNISTDIIVNESTTEVPYTPVYEDDPGINATRHVKILICS
jgi:hypothetical protein